MNNLKKLVFFARLFSLISFMACSDASQTSLSNAGNHLSEAKDEVKQAANNDIESAKNKAGKDWQKFKFDSDASIIEMNKQVAELNEKIIKANDSAKSGLKVQLTAISEKIGEQNEKLRVRGVQFEADMKTFDESVVSRNESFKREFKHDMDELGTAIKNLFNDNVK